MQKAGSMGSAEPDFFQILRQICSVFRQISKFTKAYQSLPKFTNFTKFDKHFTKFYIILQNFHKICDLRTIVAI